jgi:hypothetical protein
MSDCFENASAAEQKRLTNAVAQNENPKKMETEKLLQGQYAVAERGTDHLRKSAQRRGEWASQLGQDLAAARRDVETQTALVAKANDEASRLKTAESGAAPQLLNEAGGSNFMLLVALEELRKSLQQEHDKNEALALELSTARANANMYAYDQAHKASDEVADLKQAAEVSADGLRKSQERATRLEQDLAAARRDVETQTALAAKATDDAGRAKQAADTGAAELGKSLQQEQERAGHLEQDLAAARRDVETQKALAAKATDDAGQAKQAADTGAAELRKSLQQERERAGRLEQDLVAARHDVETQTALATKASDEAGQLKQVAEKDSAELKQSLQKEHERAEALAKDLSTAHTAIYAYEAQTRKAKDQAAEPQQAVENGAAALRKSLQQEQERAGRLEQDLAAARRDVQTQTALVAKANEDAIRSKQAAENGSAELKRSLQKEHDRAEALVQNLSMVHTAVYTYEVQSRMASDQAVIRAQSAASSAAELRKSLQQEQERTARLQQDLAVARHDVETQTALAAKAGAEAARLKQAAADSATESQKSLQQERDKTARLERDLASERKPRDVPAASAGVTAGQVRQDKPPADVIKPVAVNQATAAATRSDARPDPMNAAEVARLVARASVLLGQGDIGSARIVLERAAETGNAQASFALAETYDPIVLRKWGAYGTLGDAAKARDLYARAQAGGIKEARERFDALRR